MSRDVGSSQRHRASARSSSSSARVGPVGATCASSGHAGPTLAWKRERHRLRAPRAARCSASRCSRRASSGCSAAVARRSAAGRSASSRCSCASRSSRCSRSGSSRLARTATTQKVCTVYLVDVSESVPDAALDDARGRDHEGPRREAEGRARPRHHVRAAPARRADRRRREGAAPALERHDAASTPKATRARQARASAPRPTSRARCSSRTASIPPGYLRRAVLLSDGVQTDGDILAEANRARDFGVKLFTVPYHRPVPGEVAVRELRVPDKVQVGEPFELHAEHLLEPRRRRRSATLKQGEAHQRPRRRAHARPQGRRQRRHLQERRPRRRRGHLRARAHRHPRGPLQGEQPLRGHRRRPGPARGALRRGQRRRARATLAARSRRRSSTSTCARPRELPRLAHASSSATTS